MISLVYEEHPPVGILLHSYRNCPLDVWRFSPTRQYRICHRSGRLGDRVGYTLDFKLYHSTLTSTPGISKDKLDTHLLDLRCLLLHGCCWAPVRLPALPRLRRKGKQGDQGTNCAKLRKRSK